MNTTNTNNLNTYTVNCDSTLSSLSMDKVVYEDIQRRLGKNVLPIFIDDDIDIRKKISVSYVIEKRGRPINTPYTYETTVGNLLSMRGYTQSLYRNGNDMTTHQRLSDKDKYNIKGMGRMFWVIFCHLKIRGRSKNVIRSLKKTYSLSDIDLMKDYIDRKLDEDLSQNISCVMGSYVGGQYFSLDKEERDDNSIVFTDHIEPTDEVVDDLILNGSNFNPIMMENTYDNDFKKMRKGLKRDGFLSVTTSFEGGL